MFTDTTKLKIMQIVLMSSILFALAYASSFLFTPADVAQGEVYSAGCSSMTRRVADIGNQSSVLLVASTTNRAALHIQQRDNATNTVYFNFSYASATVATGTWILEKVSATGTVREMDIGKGGLFPYTGPITAITDVGSSTILITECLY